MSEMKLPFLGEGIDEAKVMGILVSVGDTVKKDDPIIEVETGKAAVEVPASFEGKIEKIHVSEGDKLKPEDLIVTFADGRGEKPAEKDEKKENETQEKSEDKPAEEKPEKTAKKESTEDEDGDDDGEEEEEEEEKEKEEEEEEEKPTQKRAEPKRSIQRNSKTPGKLALAAPSVRKLAREIGVDVNEVPGSGPHGRVSSEDVKAYSREQHEGRGAKTAGTGIPSAPPLPDFSKWGDTERKEMSTLRKAATKHLSSAWSTIPHVTQFDKADITNLEKLRKKFSKKSEEQGAKLTVTAILVKVIASALKVYPQFNSSLDLENQEIVFKKYFHVGLAVDTEYGLVVPVIRDVDQKNMIDLAVEINEVAEKARNRKLSQDDMQGGSFTISNLGGIGGTYFTPIINQPEVAILGVSRGAMEPVYIDGEFVPRMMLPLSLSYDHRVIDGADGARFLRWICEALQQPFILSLQG